MMKKSILIFLLFYASCSIAFTQCLPDGIVFSTQSQIDQFTTNYPNCTEIGGDLIVNGSDITSLNGLEVISVIGGDLYIWNNPLLVNLSGLDQVVSVGHDVRLVNNPLLSDLSSLDNITKIENDLVIGYIDQVDGGGNPSLPNLLGLHHVSSIGGALWIDENDSLTNLLGLDEVVTIGSSIIITGNDNLINLEGLDKLGPTASGLYISNNQSLVSLSGLEGIKTSTGSVNLYNNPLLTSLFGLNNIESIGYELRLQNNASLVNLEELIHLTSVGQVFISTNPELVSLRGLRNLNNIDQSLWIRENTRLKSLEGFENINKLGDDLWILKNDSLQHLNHLSKLSTIGGYGYLIISENGRLTSLHGLDNINPNSIKYLSIKDNPLLSTCEVHSICNYLANPDFVKIEGNASGCASRNEVVEACESTFAGCLEEGLTISSQQDLELFTSSYPDCVAVEGDVFIEGDDVANLWALSHLISIQGNLTIINNPNLIQLAGLDNIQSVGGNVIIGDDSKGGNPLLADISALSNVMWIGGSLVISGNESLSNLVGLEHIISTSFDTLKITNNVHLSNCNIENICDFLFDSTGEIIIHSNALGCNSSEEVQAVCSSDLVEIQLVTPILIYPNPARNSVFVQFKNQDIIDNIRLLNTYGQVVAEYFGVTDELDISHLANGLYFVKVLVDNHLFTGKLIVENQ